VDEGGYPEDVWGMNVQDFDPQMLQGAE